jgi:hypothetical protein
MPDDIRDRLVAWAQTEAAARAQHQAWVAAMHAGHHDVEHRHTKWNILTPDDQVLAGRLAVLFMTAALDAVEGVADGH